MAKVPVLETRDERTITIGAWDFSIAGGITERDRCAGIASGWGVLRGES